jgi:hypothetical protein
VYEDVVLLSPQGEILVRLGPDGGCTHIRDALLREAQNTQAA